MTEDKPGTRSYRTHLEAQVEANERIRAEVEQLRGALEDSEARVNALTKYRDEWQARAEELGVMLVDTETEKIERGTRIERLCEALTSISRYVSWCNHGEADRGTTLDKIDEIASAALGETEAE